MSKEFVLIGCVLRKRSVFILYFTHPHLFNENKLLTHTLQARCGTLPCNHLSSYLESHMVIGTSAMIQTELDCVVNQYTDLFCNPMLMWGKYRRHWFSTRLPISFQFHHVQMDGGHAATFLESLQETIRRY